jgi:hypothetical protein
MEVDSEERQQLWYCDFAPLRRRQAHFPFPSPCFDPRSTTPPVIWECAQPLSGLIARFATRVSQSRNVAFVPCSGFGFSENILADANFNIRHHAENGR